MKRQILMSLLAVYSVACATSSRPVAAPPETPLIQSTSRIDAEEFRRALEEAYSQIQARSETPPPLADVEAVASMTVPEHRTINGALTYFTTRLKDSIQASLLKSARYRKLIDSALAQEKLPKGLAYLPVIESAYETRLTSRAGAHGIWQFMPATAREYGLRVDWWVDERADPERSTRAAARYLRDLYRQFSDWPLALAAYNAGPGRIRRALESSGSTTYWQLLEKSAIPKETRGYVPTFYATLLIASDPETYGFELRPPEPMSGERRVEVEGPVSLQYVAEVAEVDEQLIRDLNPALKRGVVPPGRLAVKVPSRSAEILAARVSTLRTEDPYLTVCTYTLSARDTVTRLARAVGTTVDEIASMNNLRVASGVGAGQTIYLPVRARELASLLAHDAAETFYYTVKKGDTMFSIARRHDLTMDELLELNQLARGTALRKGQKLRVSAPRGLTAGGG